MEPKLIDLSDFTFAGGGFMGESYNHRDDPGIMLKLYPLDWTRLAEKEYDRAVKAFALGVPTPEAKDLGVFMSAVNYSPEEKIRELYHMDKRTALRFWQVFLRAYSGGDRPLKELEEEIKPYAALRSLLVQRVIGRLIPERQPLVECLFA